MKPLHMAALRDMHIPPSPLNGQTAQNREHPARVVESGVANRESREARLQDLLFAAFRCCSRSAAGEHKLQRGLRLSLDTGRRR